MKNKYILDIQLFADDVMTFDEILQDKVYQAEFDRRVTQALDKVKAKHKEELELLDVQGQESKYNALQSEYDTYKSEQESKFVNTLKTHALDKVKLQSGANDEKLFSLVLDSKVNDLEFDTETNSFKGIDEVLETIKTEHASLFLNESNKAGGVKTDKIPPKKEKTVFEELQELTFGKK